MHSFALLPPIQNGAPSTQHPAKPRRGAATEPNQSAAHDVLCAEANDRAEHAGHRLWRPAEHAEFTFAMPVFSNSPLYESFTIGMVRGTPPGLAY